MRLSYVSIAVIAGLLMSSCGGGSDEQKADIETESSVADVKFRIGVAGESVFEMYLARSGEFEDLGYGIELVNFDSSGDTFEALRAGAIDVAHFLQVPNVVIAQGNAVDPWTSENTPIALDAAWSNPEHPGFCLVVKDGSIDDIGDLSGKKVAYSKGSVGHYFFESLVEEAGLEDVEAVQLAPPEGRSAFLSGAVDALVTVYRAAVAIEQEGSGRIIDTSSRIMDYYQVTAVQRSLLEDSDKVGALKDLIERSNRAAVWARDNFDDVVAFNVESGVLDQESAEFVARYEPRLYLPFVGEFTSWIDRMAELFLRSGVIASDVDPSVLFNDVVAQDSTQSP